MIHLSGEPRHRAWLGQHKRDLTEGQETNDEKKSCERTQEVSKEQEHCRGISKNIGQQSDTCRRMTQHTLKQLLDSLADMRGPAHPRWWTACLSAPRGQNLGVLQDPSFTTQTGENQNKETRGRDRANTPQNNHTSPQGTNTQSRCA